MKMRSLSGAIDGAPLTHRCPPAALRPSCARAPGRRYGARALNEGGLQSLPALAFPGGALLGCAAGMLDGLRLKGSHMALQSGMLAAEAVTRRAGPPPGRCARPVGPTAGRDRA